MQSKTIIITGASDGIGAAAARELKQKGHNVVVIGRSPEKTAAVGNELGAPFFIADFADLSQVRDLGAAILAQYPKIDVLANNAGGIFGSRERTNDGFELTFQVNHLAPFLLTNLLLDLLIASKATVINTASLAARMWGEIDLDDVNSTKHFKTRRAYGTSKLENILFTRELQRRYGASGINAVAFHPGTVATNFSSESTSWVRFAFHSPLKYVARFSTPEKGARQLVRLAETVAGIAWLPGEYYERGKIAKTHAKADVVLLARKLWDLSMALAGLEQ